MKCALVEPSGRVIKLKWVKDPALGSMYLRRGKSKNKIVTDDLKAFCATGGHIETTDKAFFLKIIGKIDLNALTILEVPAIISDIEIEPEPEPKQKAVTPIKKTIRAKDDDTTSITDITKTEVNEVKKRLFKEKSLQMLRLLGRADLKDIAILLHAEQSTISRYLNPKYRGAIGLYYIQALDVLLHLTPARLNKLFQEARSGSTRLSPEEFTSLFKEVESELNCSSAFIARLLGVKKNIYSTLSMKKPVPPYTMIPLKLLKELNDVEVRSRLIVTLSENFKTLGGLF